MARVKGKATCSVVDAECEAPAGIQVGGSVASLPGKRGLYVCEECGDPVCKSCSMTLDIGRVCAVRDERGLTPLHQYG